MGKPTRAYYEAIDEAFPRELEVGDICEWHPEGMLKLDGGRWKIRKRRDHTRIEIVGVPDSRSENLRYIKLDPKPMGNGRRDRQVKRWHPKNFKRHYRLVQED